MTEQEAISVFMTTVGKHLEHTDGDVTAVELAEHMVSDHPFEVLSAFTVAFRGQCKCPHPNCLNKLIDAVSNCMDRCDQIFGHPQAPTSSQVH